MAKEISINVQTGNVVERELTTEEINQLKTQHTEMLKTKETEEKAKAEKQTLKDSAKAKLIAGEKLTEEESNIIVI